MTKLNYSGFEKFLSSIPSSTRVFLSYGNDEGLVFETAEAVAKKINPDLKDPFNVEYISMSQIKENAGAIYMAASSTSLMGGRKLIIIKEAGDTATAGVKDFLELNNDAFLVLFGVGLNRKSTLLQAVESSNKGAALACYADDVSALRQLIIHMLNTNNVQTNEDTISFLITKLGADRKMTRSEMNKLLTYLGDEKKLTLDMAKECIDDASTVSFERLTDAIFSRNPKAISTAIAKLYGEGESEIAILRIATSFIKKYIPAYKIFEESKSITNAIANIKPKPNFKQEAKIKADFKNWSYETLNKAIDVLLEAEISCKTTNYPLSQVCERALLQIINLK